MTDSNGSVEKTENPVAPKKANVVSLKDLLEAGVQDLDPQRPALVLDQPGGIGAYSAAHQFAAGREEHGRGRRCRSSGRGRRLRARLQSAGRAGEEQLTYGRRQRGLREFRVRGRSVP